MLMHITYQTYGGIRFSVIGGKNLVPLNEFLSTVFPSNRAPAHFFEPSTNSVYSIATGNLKKLTGTKGTSKAEQGDFIFSILTRRFALSDISLQFAQFVRANSYSFQYTQWKPANPGHAQSPLMKAAQAVNPFTHGNVIIGSIQGDGSISFSANPAVHTNEQSWKTEIERLALASPGKRYVAVQVVGSVVSGGLVWN
jgi:hypothetical protein